MATVQPPRFPGLRQPESIILDTWQRTVAPASATFDYNVPVGQGIVPDKALPDHVKQMAVKNSQRKIDAVMSVGQARSIIEVKERAQLGSIGQLLGYQHLWEQEHPGETVPAMVLITARLSPGVLSLAARMNITVHVVPADFSPITGAV